MKLNGTIWSPGGAGSTPQRVARNCEVILLASQGVFQPCQRATKRAVADNGPSDACGFVPRRPRASVQSQSGFSTHCGQFQRPPAPPYSVGSGLGSAANSTFISRPPVAPG